MNTQELFQKKSLQLQYHRDLDNIDAAVYSRIPANCYLSWQDLFGITENKIATRRRIEESLNKLIAKGFVEIKVDLVRNNFAIVASTVDDAEDHPF